MRITCLVGNGLSIAFNPGLAVPRLTQALLDSFGSSGDPALAVLARAVAERGEGFEQLLGPFDAAADALASIPGFDIFAEQRRPPLADVGTALRRSRQFLQDVYRAGVSITLELIAELGRATEGQARQEVVERFCTAVAGLGEPEELTVATLNYDGLLHAGFLTEVPVSDSRWDPNTRPLGQIADLADGSWGAERRIVVIPGQPPIEGHPLRTQDDLPLERIALLQLHGSLAWLRDPEDPSQIWKFNLEDLRGQAFWDRWGDGATDWEPVVVLTNRKEPAVGRWPFSLAYEAFTRRLADADRWLMVGYGLGDAPVNRAFHEARRRRGGAPPTLIIGRGGDVAAPRRRVSAHLGIPADRLRVSLQGAPEALEDAEWQAWLQDED